MKENSRNRILFICVVVVSLVSTTLFWCYGRKIVVTNTPKSSIMSVKMPLTQPIISSHKPAIVVPASSQGVQLKSRLFSQLEGWRDTRLKPSFDAFQYSCRTFLHDDPSHHVGSSLLPLKAKDWFPACQAAKQINANSEVAIHRFFENWFTPIEFVRHQTVKGLFTGYYVPLLKARLQRSADYSVPIYAPPQSSSRLKSFYSRAEIDRGAIAGSARVLAWVKNQVDRLVLETEGSGVVELEHGEQIALGYAADNGGKYRALASLAIEKGYVPKHKASMNYIRTYFEKHPALLKPLIEQNQSFVFFRKLPDNKVYGSQGIPLSPGYSMAVDRRFIPMGVPLWLTTRLPNQNETSSAAFNRLMVAQDTGGSIRGLVRGDIFWGPGEMAARMANYVKSQGSYVVLVPNGMA